MLEKRLKIEKRTEFWKKKHYRIIESGKGWKIERPYVKESPDLEVLLNDFFKKKKKWE